MMSSLQWCFAVCWVTVVAGGLVRGPDEVPEDIAVDNAYLEDYAANALLSVEERKIVALLERIESKFETLNEDEKVEFVKKISNYQDRFASTLAKVETIPGMYGLNVPMLRANLGIPGIEEHVEEIHEDFEEVLSLQSNPNDIPDASVEDGESIAAIETKITEDMSNLARKAGLPYRPQVKASVKHKEPKKTMDDLYDVMAQLVNLVMVQIIQEMNQPEPTTHYHPAPLGLPSTSYPTPSLSYPTPTYPTPTYPTPTYPPRPLAPTYQYPSKAPKPMRPNQRQKSNRYKNKPQKNVNKNTSPFYNNLDDLFSSIPPHYDEVTMNLNYDKKKKRKRRGADTQGHNADQADYDHWYNYTYLPWLRNYEAQVMEYNRLLAEYNAAQQRALVPSNPFGNSRSSFYSYSKRAYNNFLHEQVQGTNPQVQHAEAYNKWVCEKDAVDADADGVIDDGEQCWLEATAIEPSSCGIMAMGVCVVV